MPDRLAVRHFLSATCATFALAGAAQAGIVNYDFDGANSGNLGPTESFTSGAYTVVASAFRTFGGPGDTWTAANVSRNTNALGVNSNSGSNPGQVDTNGAAVEGLLFDFGTAHFVSLTIQLSAFRLTGNNADNIDLWIGDTFDAGSVGSPLSTQLLNDATPSNPFTINFASRYLFIAASDDGDNTIQNCTGGSNCFRVDNITAVPEPGSLALVGLGLVAAAGLRRRRG